MTSPGKDTSTTEDRSFAESLLALKRQGCSVLVVGTVPENVHAHACERLLGDSEAETRRRLIVRGESTDRVGMAVADDPSTRVIEHPISARAGAVETGDAGTEAIDPGTIGPDGGPEAGVSIDGDGESGAAAPLAAHGLAALREEVLTAIEAVAASVDGLSAAELRVCLDSLVALVDAHDHGAVTRLLRPVFDAVRAENGMVHGHLPVARDAGVVETLEPLFDAVVALRVEAGRPQQRWRLREGPSSAWLPLRSPRGDTRGGSR